MTSGNLFPAGLLVLFLATGIDLIDVQSFRQTTPRASLHIVLVTLSAPSDSMGHLSDAFESSLHLRGLAEDARSSLLRLADRAAVEIELLRVKVTASERSFSSWLDSLSRESGSRALESSATLNRTSRRRSKKNSYFEGIGAACDSLHCS